MAKPKLIVFFGADGSGKTTQAVCLSSYFKERGFRVKRVWIRAHHSFSSVLGKMLMRFGYFEIVCPRGKKCKQFDVKLLPKLRAFWGFLEFSSVMPLVLLKVKLPLLFGYHVIAERYVVDTIVSIAYFLADQNFLCSRLARLLLLMLPPDAFVIHLDADTTTILKRRSEERLNPDFIDFQRESYFLFAASLSTLSVDTSKNNAMETLRLILSKFENS